MTHFENITNCLGAKTGRYFSNGFKSIDISYSDIIYSNNILSANVKVGFNANWSKKNNESLIPHLGTTEFVSIAGVISQQLLKEEMKFSDEEIASSWINRFSCKTRKCTNTDYNNIQVSGKIVSTIDNNKYSQTCINVKIDVVQVTVYVRHSKNIASKDDKCESKNYFNSLYHNGYKQREHFISNVVLDDDKLTSWGDVIMKDENIQCNNGIGAKYSGMMITDFILVTGQLTQALIYNMNNTKREENGNMWLREIDVWSDAPPTDRNCESLIKFNNVNTLNMNNEVWQSVELSGMLGNMNSKIKVAQRLN